MVSLFRCKIFNSVSKYITIKFNKMKISFKVTSHTTTYHTYNKTVIQSVSQNVLFMMCPSNIICWDKIIFCRSHIPFYLIQFIWFDLPSDKLLCVDRLLHHLQYSRVFTWERPQHFLLTREQQVCFKCKFCAQYLSYW